MPNDPATPSVAHSPAQDAPRPPQPEAISSNDKGVLAFAGMRRQLARSEAETALAKNEVAETAFTNTMLQLYLKYNLVPEKDSIDEQGTITRNVRKQGETK
jgi:hypothetical protein